MDAWIYTRVSKDTQATGRSVTEQEADCRKWAVSHGWEVTRVYTDNDRSASRYASKPRPDWLRLTDDLTSNHPGVLIVWEISRATRDRLVWGALVELCRDRRVQLCVGGRLHDLTDPDDAFLLDLTQSLAVRESDVTSKRILRTVAASAEKGWPHGKLLYGYAREYDADTGRLLGQVVDERTAAVVREIHGRVLAGESCRSIGRDLEARAILSPRGSAKWDLTTVKRIAVNPAYAALRVHRGVVVGPAGWPALVDELSYHRMRARLDDPSRRTTRDSSVKHLLTGIARCGLPDCGAPVRLMNNRGTPTYICGVGFHVARKQAWVDTYVTDVILERLSRADAADLFASDDDAATEALAEAAVLRARLDAFTDSNAAPGGISPAALARVEAKLLPKIEAAERAALAATVSPVVASLSRDPLPVWEALGVPQRRVVLRELVDVRILRTAHRNRVFDRASVTVTFQRGR